MTSNTDRYRTYITQTGFGLEALANQQGVKVDFAELVLGDGVLPDESNPASQTDLVNQIKNYPVTIEVDESDPTIWIARAEIPANDGGFKINEAGVKVTGADGDLYCYARQPGDYKPLLEEGAAKSYTIRLKFIPGNASVIEAKIDPSVQFATPTDLANAVKEHEAKANPHPNYATDEDLANAIQQSGSDLEEVVAAAQFLPYDSKRTYKTGEVCYTELDGELSYWQWYSNIESLAGKNPQDVANRHIGWTDNTKPFYWIPYTGDQVGMPFFWLDTVEPEHSVMEINADLPVSVYWRLARCYPHLVMGESINTGEIRGEFLRVLDQGRGVDVGRMLNSKQNQMIQSHNHAMTLHIDRSSGALGNGVFGDEPNYGDAHLSTGLSGGNETRPRNIARPIAITI
ncbi:phage tail protein [Vibrio splendidus]|uniref:phage tail protein n=1 Tax=Vibrio splendidus TaxID=29497 RepID=UPI000C837C9D|nr:phage tail protein [Vibrio splendidus]PMI49572.1 hypothetical protein BCU42_14355 [Vibrio splendidus]